MLDYLRNFSALDFALIVLIALFGGLLLRRWQALAWMVMAALAADFALPFAYYLLAGDGFDLAWARASRRFVDNEGGMLIWRTAAYFAIIGAIFGGKTAWGKR
jgi:hypothetical protein